MTRAVDAYIAMKFLKHMSTPFTKWKAFELGLIDDSGKSIRKAENNTEKSAVTPFLNLIRNMKRLLSKFPGGKGITASVAVGLILLKEDCDNQGYDGQSIAEESLQNLCDTGMLDQVLMLESYNNYQPIKPGRYIIDSPFYARELVYITEDVVELSNSFAQTVFKIQDTRGLDYYVTKDHLEKV